MRYDDMKASWEKEKESDSTKKMVGRDSNDEQ